MEENDRTPRASDRGQRPLDKDELAAEDAVELPEREEMSLINPTPIGPPGISIE